MARKAAEEATAEAERKARKAAEEAAAEKKKKVTEDSLKESFGISASAAKDFARVLIKDGRDLDSLRDMSENQLKRLFPMMTEEEWVKVAFKDPAIYKIFLFIESSGINRDEAKMYAEQIFD